ncbi:MAG: hypothetical protein CMN78_05170 [Spirochaetales bacterium]|nr:hypothetical protein [Spirochaetales bacterium]
MATTPAGLPLRTLGKTGEKVPVFGLGTGEAGMGLAQKEALELYNNAIDLGVTYLDTAPAYDKAQEQLCHVLKERRNEVMVATKVGASNGEKFLEGLHENLKVLGTDFVDIAFIHSVGSQDIDELLSSSGSLEALFKAKRRGMARYIGFTAHNHPASAERILGRTDALDVVMFAMNFLDRHVYNFENRVLPLAIEQNLGVAAMKVYGGTVDMDYTKPVESALSGKIGYDHQLAFRYSLGLAGVALSVIGVYSISELKENIRWATDFVPLAAEEDARLAKDAQKALPQWGERFGPVE